MKVAVIGLGVEGTAAVKSLIKRGYEVYASDIDDTLIMGPQSGLEIELGSHDMNKIHSQDAYMLSPSLWNVEKFKSLKSSGKILSDIFNSHKSIPTIGVTGTNGKTTTCLMITKIFEKAGYNVLVGGNAGGGFEGYAEIFLKSSSHPYDLLVVEVCDMTLDFCRESFNMDIVVVTNQGKDHMDVHKSQENYLKSLEKFIKAKNAVLNGEDPLLTNIANSAANAHFFKKNSHKLNVFGSFNQENAAAAAKVCEIFGLSEEEIESGLESFEGVEGRTTIVDFAGSEIVIGKTDNAAAAAAVLGEAKFELVIIGTPRKNETWRYDILDEIVKIQPKKVGLFPGLDDTVDIAKKKLIKKGFKGEIVVLHRIQDVVDMVMSNKYHDIFIGGNGQSKLIEITERLKILSTINK